MNPQDWSSIGKGNHPIALTGLLDSSLHDFVYTRNIDDPSTSTLNSDDLQTLVNILKTNNIDGVYYNSKIPKENAIYVGRGKEFIAVTKPLMEKVVIRQMIYLIEYMAKQTLILLEENQETLQIQFYLQKETELMQIV